MPSHPTTPRTGRRPRAAATILLATALTGVASCAGNESPRAADDEDPAAASFTLTSSDLSSDGHLPDWATGSYQSICDGENRSPRLEWRDAPAGTESFVVTMTDPAHPDYVHWVVTGIPADTTVLEQGDQGAVTAGVVGRTFDGDGTYVGPCAPDNPYVYTVHAVDQEAVGTASTTLHDALGLIDGHVLATAELEVRRDAN